MLPEDCVGKTPGRLDSCSFIGGDKQADERQRILADRVFFESQVLRNGHACLF
jgi:hypothetical protein